MDEGGHGKAKGSQVSANLNGHTERNTVTLGSRLVPIGGGPRCIKMLFNGLEQDKRPASFPEYVAEGRRKNVNLASRVGTVQAVNILSVRR